MLSISKRQITVVLHWHRLINIRCLVFKFIPPKSLFLVLCIFVNKLYFFLKKEAEINDNL